MFKGKKPLSFRLLGIGGVGVGPLAEILHKKKHIVSGHDAVASAMTDRLIRQGVFVDFDPYRGYQADCMVYSSAIFKHHPQRVLADNQKIPSFQRGYILSELMQEYYNSIAIAGAHGKTSTTGLITHLCMAAGLDPTVLIGGYCQSIEGYSVLGRSNYFITEADESDASLLFLKPKIAVITNIDNDHIENYDYNLKYLQNTYKKFLEGIPDHYSENNQSNWAVLCQDDLRVVQLMETKLSRAIITYGMEDRSIIQGTNFKQLGNLFCLTILRKMYQLPPLHIQVPLIGIHNATNVLAAVAVATLLKISDEVIQKALFQYAGVKRRVEYLGEFALEKTAHVSIFDDYGHHPTEIYATIHALRKAWPNKRIVLVFQPHRHTRTHYLLKDFAKVLAELPDQLLLLPTYVAREEPMQDLDNRLVNAIKHSGRVPILVSEDTVLSVLKEQFKQNDIILFQGAGKTSAIADRLMQSKNVKF